MRLLVVVFVTLLGCTKPNPKSCLDSHCSDPDLPFCDADGAIGGEPNQCIAVDCTPGAVAACREDRALTCNGTGDNYDLVECEFGCDASAGGCVPCNTSECEQHIIPKYLSTVCNQLSEYPALAITSDASFDTGNVECQSVVAQVNGPEICVRHYGTVSIDQNITYAITGTRALALVADGRLTINGILDVSASVSTNGPGGGLIKSGMGMMSIAGGGAGYRHAGGAGGTTTDGGANNGGTAQTNPAQLAELLGGTQPTKASNGKNPGGGGGAVTLISCRDAVSVAGLIDAGGGGGQGQGLNGMTVLYASGGGSGGTVVLQGMMVDVTGQLFANGGGGGSGDQGFGSDGLRSTMIAPGGTAALAGGSGGYGGTSIPPGSGIGHPSSGGAGGGSSGFFLVYTPAANPPTLTPLAVSPGIEPKGNIGTNR